MKLSNVLLSATALVFCFTLTACGGGAGDTLNENERGSYVGLEEFNQNGTVRRTGEDRLSETVISEECTRLKELSESRTLTRINILNLEADGTVRATYFNEFGLFDPRDERLDIDLENYILGRIVINRGNMLFENSQPAFGKTTMSGPDENQVITANKSIQRTSVDFFTPADSPETVKTVDFTTDTVGSFGVEDRASFEYIRVDKEQLREMITTVQRYCLK